MSEHETGPEQHPYLAEHPNAEQNVDRAHAMALKGNTDRYNAAIKREAGRRMVGLFMDDGRFISKLNEDAGTAQRKAEKIKTERGDAQFAVQHEAYVTASEVQAAEAATGQKTTQRRAGPAFGSIEEFSQDEKRAAIKVATEQAEAFDQQAEEKEARAAALYDEGQEMLHQLTPKK